MDLLVVLRRQAGFDAARQIELLAAISRDDPSNDKWSIQEIAAVLRIAPATAATQVHRAEMLTTTLRKTLAALRAGDITARHAELLASAVLHLDPDIARAVEERVLDQACGADGQPVPGLGGAGGAGVWTRPASRSGTPTRWSSGGWCSPPTCTAWPSSGPTSRPTAPPRC